MLCVLILYISGGTYSLKSSPNDRFFEKFSFHKIVSYYSKIDSRFKKKGDVLNNIIDLILLLLWLNNSLELLYKQYLINLYYKTIVSYILN